MTATYTICSAAYSMQQQVLQAVYQSSFAPILHKPYSRVSILPCCTILPSQKLCYAGSMASVGIIPDCCSRLYQLANILRSFWLLSTLYCSGEAKKKHYSSI